MAWPGDRCGSLIYVAHATLPGAIVQIKGRWYVPESGWGQWGRTGLRPVTQGEFVSYERYSFITWLGGLWDYSMA